jgi:hypothetical protein
MALEKALAFHPSLVITDFTMPRLNGLEVLEVFAKRLSRDPRDHSHRAGGSGAPPACGRGGAVRLLGEADRGPAIENAGRQGTRA